MKVQTKLSAFTLALALAGGALIGCGSSPAPAPAAKYPVSHSSDTTKYRFVEEFDATGYEAGVTVTFELEEVNPTAYKVSAVESEDVTVTTVSALHYSFVMPAKEVYLNVKTEEVKSYQVVDPADIPAGKEVQFGLKYGGTTKNDVDFEIRKNAAETKEMAINVAAPSKVTFAVDGTYLIDLYDLDNERVAVSAYQVTVRAVAHGETIDDPLNIAEAEEEAHKLPITFAAKQGSDTKSTWDRHPSELEYYIEGIIDPVHGVELKDSSYNVTTDPSKAVYATFYLIDQEGSDFGFEVYQVKSSTSVAITDLEAGSKVIVKSYIMNFGFGKWVAGEGGYVATPTTDQDKGQPESYSNNPIFPSLAELHNDEATLIVFNETAEKVKISSNAEYGNTYTAEATVLPTSLNAAAVISVEDDSVASVDGKVVTGLAAGTTNIVATYNGLEAKLPLEVVDGEVTPDAGTDIDYPYTVAEAIAKAIEIGETSNGVKYYIRGLVKSIKTAYSSQNQNISLNLIDEGKDDDIFIAYQTGITQAEAESIVAGRTIVTVYGTIYNYKGDTPETEGKKASSVVRIVTPEVPLSSITVDPATKELRVDDHFTFTAVPNQGAALGDVTWSVVSGDGKVSINSATGEVTALAVTEEDTPAVIRATSNQNSEVYGEAEITVVEKGSIIEETVTMQYSGTTTQNLAVDALAANATLVGLDGTVFGVNTNEIGSYKNKIGLNKDGTIRLYANTSDGAGSLMTLSITGGTIKSIAVTLGSTGSLSNLEVKAGGSTVTGTAGAYTIEASSLTLQNVIKSSNIQIWISSIAITYVLD